MGNAIAESLYRIAGQKAEEGLSWDALHAQLAADALLISEEMEKNPRAMVDISQLRSLEISETGLTGVAAAFRRELLRGLDSWGISGRVAAALPKVELRDAQLHPAEADVFAATWLAGRELKDFAAAESARATRFAVLADRLFLAGDYMAAARSGKAADTASLAAHYGTEASAIGDTRLAGLRTALLLAEDAHRLAGELDDIRAAGRHNRQIHESFNLTDKSIHWEPISYLA